MLRNKTIYYTLLLLLMSACIKEFDPVIKSSDESKYVVMGHINDGGGVQRVNVSLSSPAESPQYIPVTGCIVTVSDNNDNQYIFEEEGNGAYNGNIPAENFIQGTEFMLEVITPAGDRIVSDYDKYYPSPPVDSVYYIREDVEGNTPGEITKGIRFHLNVNAKGYNTRNFMWEAFETYEYHVDYPVEWYYDGEVHHVLPPDSSRMFCWSTKQIPYLFTLTTRNLAQNEYTKFPLQFVDNRTNRLLIGYSLLVKQYSLSDSAYRYWDQMRINSLEQGGLYTKQPLSIQGNLHIDGNPDQKVLGVFTVSSIKEKRIFVRDVENLPIIVQSSCNFFYPRRGLSEISPYDYPAYLVGDRDGYLEVIMVENCVNCLLAGGINVKPDFWPW